MRLQRLRRAAELYPEQLASRWMETRYILLSVCVFTALVDFGCFFSFLIYTQSVRLIGQGISLSQGRYLHTEQHKHRINTHRHPCLKWNLNPRSRYSSRQRWFMPYTAQPLWSADMYIRSANFYIIMLVLVLHLIYSFNYVMMLSVFQIIAINCRLI
jgi:hypothetical protein